jgi:BASS family bile acid:Na+ symporter
VTAAVDRLAAAVDDYLVAWVALSVGVGATVPAVAGLASLTAPLLAVMTGAVALTLSPARFRRLRGRALATVLVAQTAMPLVAFAVARAAGLSPALTAGFVVLGAVTPELATPTMTELAGGDTALSTVVLVAVGVGTLLVVPAAVALLLGPTVAVDGRPVVEQLSLVVVLPMALGVAVRARWPARVGAHDDRYPSVSALALVLVVGIVTAVAVRSVRPDGATLASVAVAAVALNAAGYALGWAAGAALGREERIASTLSVGMRDFAVAAALLVATGFPPSATLPAVVYGVVEMTTSAGLARWFGRAN